MIKQSEFIAGLGPLRDTLVAAGLSADQSIMDCVRSVIAERDALAAAVERLKADMQKAEQSHFAWAKHTGNIDSTLCKILRDSLAATPAMNLAAVKAAAYREAAERIRTLPDRMPCAFGGVTIGDAMREVLMMAQDLERAQ